MSALLPGTAHDTLGLLGNLSEAPMSRFATFTMLVVFALGLPASALADPVLKKQAPCEPMDNGYCLTFAPNLSVPLPAPFTAREFSFEIEEKGNAMITFHGFMGCQAISGQSQKVDIDIQITRKADELADYNEPGGMMFLTRLGAQTNSSTTFNLSSTRIVPVPSSGTVTVFLNVKPIAMDTGTLCVMSNLAFSALFIPKP
jgi:hypothetical protein